MLNINPFTVMKEVEEYYSLDPGSIVPAVCECDCVYSRMYKPKRAGRIGVRKDISEARAVSMYIVKKLTGMTFPEIGEYFDCSGENVRYNYKKLDKVGDVKVFKIIDTLSHILTRGH